MKVSVSSVGYQPTVKVASTFLRENFYSAFMRLKLLLNDY